MVAFLFNVQAETAQTKSQDDLVVGKNISPHKRVLRITSLAFSGLGKIYT